MHRRLDVIYIKNRSPLTTVIFSTLTRSGNMAVNIADRISSAIQMGRLLIHQRIFYLEGSRVINLGYRRHLFQG